MDRASLCISIDGITSISNIVNTVSSFFYFVWGANEGAHCKSYGLEDAIVRPNINVPTEQGVTRANVGNVHAECDSAARRG
jgi:hypothetical protein